MDPETQRLFTVALIGLLLFFPIFNQVALTAVETLTDADHKAQFEEFFKDWDSVPPDRKLEYWDGRNAPPGDWQDGDRDDDPTTRPPDGGGPGGGNGEGGPGENGEDPNETDEPRFEYTEEVLWVFDKDDADAGSDSEDLKQNDYHWVNITWHYENFNGRADFKLTVAGEVEWHGIEVGSDMPAVLADQSQRVESLENVGLVPMTVDWDYDPVGEPTEFRVEIIGTYPVPVDD